MRCYQQLHIAHLRYLIRPARASLVQSWAAFSWADKAVGPMSSVRLHLSHALRTASLLSLFTLAFGEFCHTIYPAANEPTSLCTSLAYCVVQGMHGQIICKISIIF